MEFILFKAAPAALLFMDFISHLQPGWSHFPAALKLGNFAPKTKDNIGSLFKRFKLKSWPYLTKDTFLKMFVYINSRLLQLQQHLLKKQSNKHINKGILVQKQKDVKVQRNTDEE